MTRRRRLVVALLLAFLAGATTVVVAYRALDPPTKIYYYWVVDDHTLLVGTVSGPGADVRVTNVSETSDSVTITVSGFFFQPGPQTDEGYSYESVAQLRSPLGSRAVIDGSNGQPVKRATCRPPAYFASSCASPLPSPG